MLGVVLGHLPLIMLFIPHRSLNVDKLLSPFADERNWALKS